ncbi:MAG: hypothetical protein KBD78_15385 [Oligoflexales bacterium]|nr:hypothetical protein [Oligoflexales bacterium]
MRILKIFRCILCFVSISQISIAETSEKLPTSTTESRLQKAKLAEELFKTLTFYQDGKGMVVPTGPVAFGESPFLNLLDPIKNKVGIMIEDNQFVGLFKRTYKETNLLTAGCVACHSGKAAGQYIVGIGNKNIDAHELGALLKKIAAVMRAYNKVKKTEGIEEMSDNAERFYKRLMDADINNLTQGLVPTTVIRSWYYDIQNLPIPKGINRGQVKVPHFFGYGEKRPVGLFVDGKAEGHPPGWGLAVEFVGGQTVENIRSMMPKMEEAETLLGDFLPPKYPFAINQHLVPQGEEVFLENCARCHGTYNNDAEGLPIYEAPELIPWNQVQTDADRLKDFEKFIPVIKSSPLGDLTIMHNNPPAYFAPRLHAIWSRFPYLHNASVPSITALLTEEDQRPEVFSLKDSGEYYRFDQQRLGLTVANSDSSAYKNLLKKAKTGDRSIFYAARNGHGNEGHRFGTELSDEAKTALIEYLKTL